MGKGRQLLGPLLLHTQRPRLLLCGAEGSGQAHLGPAVLYALEGLPVHAVGLPSLLSDASARSAPLLPVRARPAVADVKQQFHVRPAAFPRELGLPPLL